MSLTKTIPRWLHIGIRNLKGEQRRQVKVYDNGKYINL